MTSINTGNNLRNKRLWKAILITQLVFFLLSITISQAASPAPPPQQDITQKLPGTWLYLWSHGNVSVGNADGTSTVRAMFTAESYGENGDQKTDSFMRFRGDGTGTFLNRRVMFKNKKKTLAVITRDTNGAWIENDVLALRYDFTWEVKENKVILSPVKGTPRFNRAGRYEFTFNDPPTRPATKEIQQIFGLKDELIIYNFGQLLRLGEKAEADLNKRYGIQ